jgi:hypothetical protein
MIAGPVAVNALVRGGSAAPPAIGADPPVEPPAPPPRRSGPTTLPGAVGASGAVDSPTAVGTDAGVIHFDLDLNALDVAATSEWTSAPGYEGVLVRSRNGRPQIEVLLGREPGRLDEVAGASMSVAEPRQPRPDPPTATTVDGRAATLVRYGWAHKREASRWVLRWQPVDGLYAQVLVFQPEPAAANLAARALRLDVAQRCAVPLRVDAAPAGAPLTTCMTALRREPTPTRGIWMHSMLTFTTASGGDIGVWAEEDLTRGGKDSSQFVPNLTVAGRPAQWRTADPRGLWLLGFEPAGELFISGASKEESIRVAAGVSVVGDLADPLTWPEMPVG